MIYSVIDNLVFAVVLLLGIFWRTPRTYGAKPSRNRLPYLSIFQSGPLNKLLAYGILVGFYTWIGNFLGDMSICVVGDGFSPALDGINTSVPLSLRSVLSAIYVGKVKVRGKIKAGRTCTAFDECHKMQNKKAGPT